MGDFWRVKTAHTSGLWVGDGVENFLKIITANAHMGWKTVCRIIEIVEVGDYGWRLGSWDRYRMNWGEKNPDRQ